MDFARKIGKSDEPRTWKRTRQPLVTARDNYFLSEETSFSEDRRFINWKKWLAERKKQNRHIEFVTGRSQIDQLQSSSEKFRAFVEMKNLMEHAPIPMVADKYRGGPEFWRTPEFLPDRGDACLPEVSLTLSRKDLNLPPDLMHVGLPNLTAKERDPAAQRTKEEFWKHSEYLKARKLELAEEIALLLPKESETATLAIQGHAYKKKKQSLFRRIPPITITEPDEDEPHEDADQAVILKIQDREFVWQRSLIETQSVDTDPITWSLTFVSKIDEQIEREIVLENKGTFAVVYHWRYSLFRTCGVFFEKRGSPFFFNKTKGLILPGQIVRLKVWYRSRICGVFTEFWRFVTEPKLSSSTFIFRFWGCTSDIRSAEPTDRQTIDEYLNCRIRDSMIHSIIEEIIAGLELDSGPLEPPYEIPLSQSDLFVSLNSCHHYHPSIVAQLQKIYSDVTGESVSTWNLSLDTLRDIILQIEDTNYRCDMLARFNELCKQSLRPKFTEFDDVHRDKYDAAYNILCAFANLFENESELVKKLNDQSETALVQEEKESSDLNVQPYKELFFIRIYKALEEAIQQVCASIDSFHRLNELKLNTQ